MRGEPVPGARDFRLMVAPEPFDPAEVDPSATPAAAGAQAAVVQFAALPSEPDIARLKAAYGLGLERFIPNLAYLERLDTATADRVRADFLVRSVIVFPPASKLSPTLPATGPLDLTMILFEDADADAVTAALTAIGAHDMQVLDDRDIGGRLHLRLTLDDPAELAQAAAIDDVIWIEPAPVFTNFNVGAAQTNQSGDPNRGTVWDRHITGKNQVIGIIDEGFIDMDHGFFADNPPNKPGPKHRKVLKAFNEALGASDHFMQVAGIAAGDALNDPGKHEHRGGAHDAKIICRSRGDMDTGKLKTGFFVFSLRRLLDASREFGATIHNLSWGSGTGYDTAARDVDAFSYDREEQLVVAAGEDTGKGPVNQPPGIAFNPILVAAAQAAPNHGSIGSGVPGPTDDGRRKPDLTAVGCGISTAVNPAKRPPEVPFYTTGPVPCATSSATPHVSAAAALVRQYFAEGFYPNGKPQPDKLIPQPSGALIKAVLLNSTVDMEGVPGYPSDAEGWGRIQLDRTLFFTGGKRKLIVTDVPRRAGLRMFETRQQHFFVEDEREQLKITFVWTNRPPAEQNQPSPPQNPPKPKVDPIRFEVEDSSGNLYLGNDFDVGKGVSKQAPVSPGLPPDILNNVQMVVVNQPVAGTWTIRLRPFLHFEKQGYALVVSGGVQ
ncbi:S8 family serine peptidase [Actinomadura chokoriensis]|uniref:S8 family serine peptidase n=1 Tax=Actinomadura chokoriensis TaxID=454156 RepID=A0ABV4QWW6_9ACTN